MSATSFALSLCLLAAIAQSATPSSWKKRSIYQVLTDRFAKNTDSTQTCGNLHDYCGGTFKGIENHLNYIQDLGFDAVWISPVVTNFPNGYHGYWAKDFYSVNSYFGSEADLLSLQSRMKSRGMYLMIDVVANHVGSPPNNDISQVNPFNQWMYYHNCDSCPPGCSIQDWNNQNQVQICRLANLPDLNQSRTDVYNELTSWVKTYVVNKWKADGVRIDTIPEVNGPFWRAFQQSAGVYAVGEVDNGNPAYDGPYQQYLDGILSYPMFYTIRDVFGGGQSTSGIDSRIADDSSHFKDVSLLGTFVDNHDQNRFLCSYPAKNGQYHRKYINALTFALTFTGIPITYYGSEQAFHGCQDPNNREVLWPTQYKPNATDIGMAITVVNSARKKAQIWNHVFAKQDSTNNFYAFTRGNAFLVLLTNVGYQSGQQNQYTLSNPGLKSGAKYCNVFWPTQDCFSYNGGSQTFYLREGEAKIYVPSASIERKYLWVNVFEHKNADVIRQQSNYATFWSE